jgi:hypothetical protein
MNLYAHKSFLYFVLCGMPAAVCMCWSCCAREAHGAEVTLNAKHEGTYTVPKIQMGGYLQSGYESVRNDVAVATDTFSLRRARVNITVEVSSVCAGFIEGDLIDSEVKDAHVSYNALPYLTARIGRQRVPVGLDSAVPESAFYFIEYAKVFEELLVNTIGMRDTGVMLITTGAWWDGRVFASNGSDSVSRDANEHKAYSGRAHVAIGAIKIGGAAYGARGSADGSQTDRDIRRYNAFLQFGDEAGFMKAEYLLGSDGSLARNGWVVTGDTGIPFISPVLCRNIPLRVLLRFEQWDPDTDIADDGEARAVFGAAYRFNQYVRGDVNYTIVREEAQQQIDNDRFNAQLTFCF